MAGFGISVMERRSDMISLLYILVSILSASRRYGFGDMDLEFVWDCTLASFATYRRPNLSEPELSCRQQA